MNIISDSYLPNAHTRYPVDIRFGDAVLILGQGHEVEVPGVITALCSFSAQPVPTGNHLFHVTDSVENVTDFLTFMLLDVLFTHDGLLSFDGLIASLDGNSIRLSCRINDKGPRPFFSATFWIGAILTRVQHFS